MLFLDRSYPTPEENLACDEVLLDACEEGTSDELLRVWQPETTFVVLGYTNKCEREVNADKCRARGIPILRRFSGGGTVLQGPGCLNYTLILSTSRHTELETIGGTNVFIMKHHRDALRTMLNMPVEFLGTSDLAIEGRKFSGNSQRRKRNFVLYHGTFLLSMDLALIGDLLAHPSREPQYRNSRSHREFLMNIGVPSSIIIQSLKARWGADTELTDQPQQQIEHLARTRYKSPEWHSLQRH
jgi:lipoate-protein ligase A